MVQLVKALEMNGYPEQIQKDCTSHQTLKFLSGKNHSRAAHAIVQALNYYVNTLPQKLKGKP